MLSLIAIAEQLIAHCSAQDIVVPAHAGTAGLVARPIEGGARLPAIPDQVRDDGFEFGFA